MLLLWLFGTNVRKSHNVSVQSTLFLRGIIKSGASQKLWQRKCASFNRFTKVCWEACRSLQGVYYGVLYLAHLTVKNISLYKMSGIGNLSNIWWITCSRFHAFVISSPFKLHVTIQLLIALVTSHHLPSWTPRYIPIPCPVPWR